MLTEDICKKKNVCEGLVIAVRKECVCEGLMVLVCA